MAKNPAERLRLAETGEELGAQLLRSVREMKAGLRGRVQAFEPGIAEACEHVGLSQAALQKAIASFQATLPTGSLPRSSG